MEYAGIEWREGEPYSTQFDDIYFSAHQGREESAYVFLQQNSLAERFAVARNFVIAETGFGSGLNFALTLKLWQESAPADAALDYIAIELAPMSPDDILRAAQLWPDLKSYFDEFLTSYPPPVAGRHYRSLFNGRVRLHYCFMDVIDALKNETLGVDAWYLDGFAPSKNPEIWNDQVFALLAQNSAAHASLATYSVAGFVRRGLMQAGFEVEKRKGHGNKREMLAAQLAQTNEKLPVAAPWYRPPQSRVTAKHAVVIGAGLAGLALAWSLIQRGWKITLVDEQAEVAAGASGNPVGLVLPRLSVEDSLDARFYRAAFLHATVVLDNLQAAHASTLGRFWCGGGVYCAMPASRADRMLERNALSDRYVRVAEDAIVQLEADTRLLFVPDGGWASPKRVCRAMLAACGNNLKFITAKVVSLKQHKTDSGTHWQLISTSGTLVAEAEFVVLANGMESAGFTQTRWLPIKPAAGQLTELVLKPGAPAIAHAVSIDHYLAPALDDDRSYYCGASYRQDDDCVQLRFQDQQQNLEFVERYFPGRFEIPEKIQGRAAVRAVSDDRMPVAGAVPEIDWFESAYHDLQHGRAVQHYPAAQYLDGLYVSAAHGSRGMTSCFLTAEVIAAQISQTCMPLERDVLEALNPSRFIIRRLKRGG